MNSHPPRSALTLEEIRVVSPALELYTRHRAPVPARTDRSGVEGKINPGTVFDLALPLDQVAEAYRAMDERRAIKALLRP